MESLSCATIKAFLLEFRLSVRLKERSNLTLNFAKKDLPSVEGKREEHKQKKINNSEKENKTKAKKTNKQTNQEKKKQQKLFSLGDSN